MRESIDREAHDRLLEVIDGSPWLGDLARRVQHYGYRYDYKKRAVDRSSYLGPLPGWADPVARRLHEDGWFARPPDQLIVNEYHPGQGISKHVDCEPCFGPTIASLTLGSSCVMEFLHRDSDAVVPLLLEPRSLVILQGESRHRWQHRILARKSDRFDGVTIPRSRRVSLTFRTVLLSDVPPSRTEL